MDAMRFYILHKLSTHYGPEVPIVADNNKKGMIDGLGKPSGYLQEWKFDLEPAVKRSV